MTVNPSRKHLVLLGAGRAHLQVLKSLAQQGSANMSVTLVSPHPYYNEIGMLPAHVAGDYALEDLRIPLDRLVEASGAAFVPAHVISLDATGRRVQLSSGDALPYDVLSVNVEPVVPREQIEEQMPGARRNALFTRPLENFVQLWPQLQSLAQERALQVAVVGDDVPAIELAMAVAHALAAPHGSRVSLVAGDAPLLADQPALQRRVLARLKALNITVLQDRCVGMDGRALQLASGATLMCDAPLLAGGAATPAWLRDAGLQAGDAGEPMVNERLQSDSHRRYSSCPTVRRSKSARCWMPTCAPPLPVAPSRRRRPMPHACAWWVAAAARQLPYGARWGWKGAKSGTGRTGATAGSWRPCSRRDAALRAYYLFDSCSRLPDVRQRPKRHSNSLPNGPTHAPTRAAGTPRKPGAARPPTRTILPSNRHFTSCWPALGKAISPGARACLTMPQLLDT